MARPRIVGETKKAFEELRPPSPSYLAPHDWLTDDSLAMYEDRLASGLPFRMYLSMRVEKSIRVHAVKDAVRRLEVMGFLLGEVRTWNGTDYSIVRDIGTTELKSSQAKVRFDPKAFPQLFLQLDDSGFDYVIVGWYHSHPGHTCFLSKTDLETQRTHFNQPYHSALVIDPLNREAKVFGLSGSGYEEFPFALVPHERLGRAKPRKRTRKLKAGKECQI